MENQEDVLSAIDHDPFLKKVDGSGYLDSAEIQSVLKDQGKQVTVEQVDELVNSIDLDGNGQIEFNEVAVNMVV